MKHSKVLLSAMLVFALCAAQAQNPWKKYGYTPPKALTLSDGKYEEFFNNDTITQIGSVMFNTVTNEVVAFVDTKNDDNETTLRPEVISRFLSPDPLEKEFPMMTPYQFASLNPIKYIDLDGLEGADIKYESGHSAQMVGKEGTDLDAYNEAFDNIVIPANIAVFSEFAIGELFGAIGKFFSKPAAAPTAVKTIVKTEGKTAQQVVKAEETAAKSEANAATKSNPYLKQTTKELQSSKKSYESLIEEHTQKLKDYKANPDKFDNLGKLKNATPEMREKIIQGRIKELEGQITKQKGELNKINEALQNTGN